MDRALLVSRHVARVVLGSVFFVFGLNGFLGFLPMPPHPGPAGDFLGALAATGYMFPLIKGTEVVAGALLLANRFPALALALLAPVIVNIVLFHAVLDPSGGLVIPLVILAIELGLAWSYRTAYAPMLRPVLSSDAPAAPASSDPRAPALASA
jgi:uncharacterized membrane protein YphA (DoxX/SURF4 family)